MTSFQTRETDLIREVMFERSLSFQTGGTDLIERVIVIVVVVVGVSAFILSFFFLLCLLFAFFVFVSVWSGSKARRGLRMKGSLRPFLTCVFRAEFVSRNHLRRPDADHSF